jgi:uncharacterized repeat protein (TIGR01451 family)
MKPARSPVIRRFGVTVKTAVFHLTRNARTLNLSSGLMRLGALTLLTTLAASVILYSTSSASSFDSSILKSLLGSDSKSKTETAAEQKDNTQTSRTRVRLEPPRNLTFPLTAKWLSAKLTAFPLLPAPPPSLDFYANDCVTPKTVFNLGDTVCVQVTGVDPNLNAHVDWIGATGVVLAESPNIVTGSLTTSFTIPLTGSVGKWRANVTSRSDGSARATGAFTVRDPNNSATDLSISKLTGDPTVAAGNNAVFQILVTNNGPDTATSVQLTDQVPSNATFAFLTQDSGPTFNCTTPAVGATGTITCTRASFARGEEAKFTVAYQVNPGAATRDEVSSTATISSATPERHTEDNTSSDTVTVFVDPCAITCPSNITVGNDQDQYGATINYPAPSSNGGCGTLTFSQASNTLFRVGTTVVTIGGASGASCSFTVTVNDTQAPVFTSCPTDITVPESSTGSGFATVSIPVPSASDNGPNVTVAGTRSDNLALNAPYPVGDTDITFTATDESGNVAATNCTFKVTVTGTASPCQLECPTDITVNTDADSCGAIVDYPAATATECGTVSYSKESHTLFPVGTTTVTVTTEAGRSCRFNVTVLDTESPVITNCPLADINVTATGSSCAAVVNVPTPAATDNCPTGLTVKGERDDGDALNAAYPVGTTIITWTATDKSGNTTSCPQIVRVRDVIPPTVTLVPNVTLEVPADSCQVLVPEVIQVSSGVPDESVVPLGTASDNCVPLNRLTIIQTPAAETLVGPGTYTITVKVYDGDIEDPNAPPPNSTTKTMTLTVVDKTKPTIALNGVNPLTVECHTSFTDPGATATDNCGAPFAATASGTVNVNTPGAYTITYNASDASGNAAIPVTRTVNVVDTTPPTLTLTGQTITLWPPNHKYVTVNLTSLVASASDGCDSTIDINDVVISKVTSDEADNGNGDGDTANDIVIAANCKSVQLRSERSGNGDGRVYTITFRVRDAAGNTTTKTAKVTVPKSQGNGGAAVDSGTHNTVNGSCP